MNEDGKFITIFYVWLASFALGQAANHAAVDRDSGRQGGRSSAQQGHRHDLQTQYRTNLHEVRLNLTETLKGKPSGEEFRLVHGGGILGGKRSRSVADPKFKVGEEVVVFVVFNSRGEAVPIGMNQGRFEVFRPTEPGEAMVRNPFHGLAKRNDDGRYSSGRLAKRNH